MAAAIEPVYKMRVELEARCPPGRDRARAGGRAGRTRQRCFLRRHAYFARGDRPVPARRLQPRRFALPCTAGDAGADSSRGRSGGHRCYGHTARRGILGLLQYLHTSRRIVFRLACRQAQHGHDKCRFRRRHASGARMFTSGRWARPCLQSGWREPMPLSEAYRWTLPLAP